MQNRRAPGSPVRVLGVIPARGGSKGIPRKNIAPLAGKPLIYYSIREARRSALLDAFLVSTDDAEIAETSRRYGADVPFLRPKRLATSYAPDIGFLAHALSWVERHRGWQPEILVILRPTAPTRTAADIDAVIRIMDASGCDSVRTVSPPYPYNPFKMWLASGRRFPILQPLLRTPHYARLSTDVPRQLLPRVYWQNGIVDATRARFVRKGIVYGRDIRGHVIPPERIVDLDEPKDLKYAALVMRDQNLL